MTPVLRLTSALLPLALTPLLLHLLGSGAIDLGGGEKDLVWVLPWALWSAAFAVSSLVLWWRGWPLGRASARAAWVGAAVIGAAAAGLAALGQLGVGGRF